MEQLVRTVRPSKPFDPAYDPNRAANPGEGKDYAPTYWIATAGPPPADDGPILGDVDVDVAIVGSGYTGLSCAIHLAREHGIKATVLEANGVAWGCSTRNGGQAQISAGRLKRSQWIERWGVDVAKKLHVEISVAFDLFRDLIRSPEIACDPEDGGHLYIAHRNKVMPSLEAESRVLNDVFGYRTRILGRDEIHRDFVRDNEAVGALYEPDGMGIHAAKLAFGYLTLARKLGARVHTSSPVLACTQKGNVFHLRTPGGIVRARAVCFATAGYTSPGLHPLTKHRLMPILSNSIVTRVLTDDERAALNFRTHIPLTDTRTLRHYYRLLPDGRVQIGSRSAITGTDAVNPKHLDRLLEGLYRKFPVLTGIKVDYSWWGWVDVSHDMMPRIFRPDPKQALFYAMGYGGNGVMYSAQAGRRMAQMVAGKGGTLDLPIFTSPLPSHGLLTPFRRIGQWGMYRWYYLKDEIL
ncbi:taurine dehydrogenase large subunit [Ensifer adhaerens]|uniref:Taurine dehydrogenase large subunit n=1 Tax=Ensifer adhaerens TaxID=106592 RepID=A0ACC5SSL2_ENSAD|nr:FAD-binding oxidoreductase [Ensifer adhaerens]MBP1871775.1 taurine dehydrogenase large subunit [Ensifer adhaerens]